MAVEAGAILLRSVAGAHADLRHTNINPFAPGEVCDADQRRVEVAFDVSGEGFERREIDDAAAAFGRIGRRAQHQLVQAPEEGGEGFAGAGGCEDERRFAACDGGPAFDLGRGGGVEDLAKPARGNGMEERERGVGRAGWCGFGFVG
jgi:hypothetical protein